MALLTKGNKQRTQESTAANKTSSRSHAILQASLKQRHTHNNHVHDLKLALLSECAPLALSAPQVTVKQKSRVKDINEEVRVGKLFMVDLAGTERASQVRAVCVDVETQAFRFLKGAKFYSLVPSLIFH